MPLALSRTQDDKGRVRWTFFGGSEQGPDRAFWKSFYSAPGQERRPEYAIDFIRRLLRAGREELIRAARAVREGGRFGYRPLRYHGEHRPGLRGGRRGDRHRIRGATRTGAHRSGADEPAFPAKEVIWQPRSLPPLPCSRSGVTALLLRSRRS